MTYYNGQSELAEPPLQELTEASGWFHYYESSDLGSSRLPLPDAIDFVGAIAVRSIGLGNAPALDTLITTDSLLNDADIASRALVQAMNGLRSTVEQNISQSVCELTKDTYAHVKSHLFSAEHRLLGGLAVYRSPLHGYQAGLFISSVLDLETRGFLIGEQRERRLPHHDDQSFTLLAQLVERTILASALPSVETIENQLHSSDLRPDLILQPTQVASITPAASNVTKSSPATTR